LQRIDRCIIIYTWNYHTFFLLRMKIICMLKILSGELNVRNI
jgi:hypothetical protein